jgi:hypothetical protein
MPAEAEPITTATILPFPTKRKRAYPMAARPRGMLPANVALLENHPRFAASSYDGDEPQVLYSPGGRRLPPLGLDRIRLSCWRATKAWRTLALELEAATDALEAALDTEGCDAALDRWKEVAGVACAYRTARPGDLRAKIALVAAYCEIPFRHGGVRRASSRAQQALELMDAIVRTMRE